MTDNVYPMVLYPPKGDMLIVNDEQEHIAALDAHWEPVIDPENPDEPAKRGPGRPKKIA